MQVEKAAKVPVHTSTRFADSPLEARANAIAEYGHAAQAELAVAAEQVRCLPPTRLFAGFSTQTLLKGILWRDFRGPLQQG